MKRRSFLLTAAAVLSLGATSTTFADEPAPKVIRVAFSGIGLGNKPASASSILSTVHQKGFLEQEFAKDGIKVEWSFFAGAGPATNEALALKKIDFATQGDLPLVVARSNGLRTKILAADSFLSKTYLIVPNGKPYQKLEDLKGKKVGVQKGTAGQLRLARLFENVGLTQDDFKLIDMNTETQNAAISTGEVDAVLSSSTDLIARGLARRILTVDDPKVISPSQIWASEEFEQKHPEIVQRFVNVVVSTAAWAADEKNRNEIFRLWAKTGYPFSDYVDDYKGDKLIKRLNPLLTDYYYASLQKSIAETKQYKFTRRDVPYEGWVEPKYLNNALKAQNLVGFWDNNDANGKPLPKR